jgi:hypothetical protein
MHCKHRSGLLLALLASCACLWADPPTQPDPRQIVELVNQLGSKSYKDRQSAMQALAKLGRLARPALQEAVNHPDPEISVRAKILLPAAVRDDLNYRLERFQADTTGKERHDLPGWDRFVELVGDTPPARKLFAAMLKAQGELIELALREPAQARTQLVILTNQILARPLKHDTNTLHIVQPGEFYAMLFAALAPKVNPPLQASQGLFDLLYKQAILDSLRPTAAEAAPARKLLAAWLREQQAGGLYSSQIVAAIDNLELTEAAAIALALAKNQTLPGRLRAEALVALARVGDKTMLRDIEPLLTDTSEIGSFFLHQSQGQTQLRDVALATLLHLSKSKLSDYEFAVARAGESELFFTPIFLGFDSNESRNTALARWRAYRKSADPRP